MQITKETFGAVCVLSPEGKIEHDTASEFELLTTNLIDEHKDSSILIDLSSVEFVSSAGLRVFLILAKKLQKEERSFGLCALNDIVNEVFETSGFNQIIAIHPTRDEGINS